MEKYSETQMDAALAKLLKRATDPAVPEGAEARLMLAIQSAGQQVNVVPFQPRSKIQNWAIGLPLAAALALGLSGSITFTPTPDAITDGMAICPIPCPPPA
jgi:hypothetical protein